MLFFFCLGRFHGPHAPGAVARASRVGPLTAFEVAETLSFLIRTCPGLFWEYQRFRAFWSQLIWCDRPFREFPKPHIRVRLAQILSEDTPKVCRSTYLSDNSIAFIPFACRILLMAGTLVASAALAVVIVAVSMFEIADRKRKRRARISWLRRALGGGSHSQMS